MKKYCFLLFALCAMAFVGTAQENYIGEFAKFKENKPGKYVLWTAVETADGEDSITVKRSFIPKPLTPSGQVMYNVLKSIKTAYADNKIRVFVNEGKNIDSLEVWSSNEDLPRQATYKHYWYLGYSYIKPGLDMVLTVATGEGGISRVYPRAIYPYNYGTYMRFSDCHIDTASGAQAVEDYMDAELNFVWGVRPSFTLLSIISPSNPLAYEAEARE